MNTNTGVLGSGYLHIVVKWNDKNGVTVVVLKRNDAHKQAVRWLCTWSFLKFLVFFFHSTNSGNTSDLFPMSPRTLDSLMHNEAEANQGHLGESLTQKYAYTHIRACEDSDLHN